MTIKRDLYEMEHEMFRDSVRAFMQKEVEPNRDEWREQGMVDREIYKKAGDHGLCMIWADEAYGGQGLTDFRYEQILIEENARYGDSGFFLTLHNRLVGPYLGELGTEEQKQRLLPKCASGEHILAIAMTEPGAGSDLSGMKTKAVEQDDHWVLNGQKTYISNGILADVVIVAARTDASQSHGIGLFIVERGMEGFERGRNLKKMGLKSQDTAELFFENVKVPKANVLGEPTKGFYALMKFLAEERLLGAAGYIAHSQVAFDITMEYVKERKVFGQQLVDFQNTRFKLAEMRTELDVAQVFVDQCVKAHNAGELSADLAAEAKLYTSELEGRVMDTCVQLHGGAGYMDEYRISRMYTDARVSRIYAGSSEIMKEIIARSMGLDPRRRKKQETERKLREAS